MSFENFRVTSVEAEVELFDNTTLFVRVIINKNFKDKDYGCKITLPSGYTFNFELMGLLAAGVLLGFAGLCSPKQVILPLLNYDEKGLSILQKIFQIVSDSRIIAVHGQENLIKGGIEVVCDNSNKRFKRLSSITRENQNILQLCSGGIDSFSAILKFLEQGKSVSLLHISNINIINTENEFKATQKISQLLNLNLEVIELEWIGLKEFGIAYNPGKYCVWPEHNAIPFGRDFILLVLGGWFSAKTNAKIVGIANDMESLQTELHPTFREDNDFSVRNELSSGFASPVILDFLKYFIDPELEIISPLLTMTKYATIDFLSKKYGYFIKELSSCVWDYWCGECNKCMIYGLLFAQYDTINIPFKKNPIELYALQKVSDKDILTALELFEQFVPD